MRVIYVGIAFALATIGLADTITLKNGRVINGTYLGGSPREIKVEVADRIETLDVSNVARIEFGGAAATASDDSRRPTLRRAPGSSSDSSDDRPTLRRGASSSDDRPTIRRDNADSADDRPVLRRADNGGGSVILRPDNPDTGASAQPRPAPATRDAIELPAGTSFVVRMIDGVDSETARAGQSFNGALDGPVMSSSGDTLIPRGADVIVKLVDAKDSGKLTGRAELTLALASVKVDGRMVDINTQTVSRESGSRGEKTAKVAGGAAVAGAVLGGILGGGKGALGGAAAGGAAGAGVEAVTKGERVKVPSETRLTFVLDTPVKI